MRHPALTRIFAVFLALLSVLTLLSGVLSIRKAKLDRQDALWQDEVLAGQIERARELRASVENGEDEYLALEEALPGEREDYRQTSSEYRRDLNEYTLSRVGLILGSNALMQASAALNEGSRQYNEGRAAFEEGLAAFEPIFSLYQQVRAGLDGSWNAYRESMTRLPSDGESPDILQPEEALALVAAARDNTAALSQMLRVLREETPADQTQTAEAILNALQSISSLGGLQSGDILRLSYETGERLYEQAKARAEELIEAGTPEEEAMAAADALIRENLDLSYAELENWLQANEDDVNEALSSLPQLNLSEEQLAMLGGYLPADQALMDDALLVLENMDRDLAQRQQELRENPEAIDGPELLMDLLQLQLQTAEHLMALFEPGLVETKAQLDAVRAQMDTAYAMLEAGWDGIREGWYSLRLMQDGLPDTEAELKERKSALEESYRDLEEREERLAEYNSLTERFRSARAALMARDGIAGRVNGGEDLIEAASLERDAQSERDEAEYRARVRICILMLAGALMGLVSAMGGFEKPRIRLLWLPVIAAILLCAAGEVMSIQLGRGLWYSALFVAIAGLAMLPLSFGNTAK